MYFIIFLLEEQVMQTTELCLMYFYQINVLIYISDISCAYIYVSNVQHISYHTKNIYYTTKLDF